MTDFLAAAQAAVIAYGDDRAAAAAAAATAAATTAATAAVHAQLDPQITALTKQVADLQAQLAAARSGTLLVGARVADISWDQAVKEVGPLKVTRVFHHALPATYSREGYPPGVRLIVSFKDPSNLNLYAASIPAGEDVELVFHHEAEKDYATGDLFVAAFNSAQQLARGANPRIPFGFIAGGYQYGAATRKGWSGSFIPPNADRYYLDSYQHGPTLTPAEKDPSVQRYLSLLATMGKQFSGFTEYGRGAVPFGGTLDPATAKARIALFPIDAAYLRSLPAVRVWSYWYTTDGADPSNPKPDQWRLTDAASQQAWRAIATA